MTTSPPMERLWIAAAGHRRREGQALPTSILGGPGPLERLPLLGPEDRPNGTSTIGRSDPTPSTSILGPDDPSRNEPLLGAGDRPDGPSVIEPGGWHHQMTNSARPETPTKPLSCSTSEMEGRLL